MPLLRRTLAHALVGAVLTVTVAAAMLLTTSTAQAQTNWPKARNVTLIVPFSAGGSLDATARLVSQRLSERIGQGVVVENVTGAGGAIGFQKTMAANPDGYTFLIAGDSPFVPSQEASANPYKFDVQKELTPVILVNTAPMVLVAHPSVAANNLGELIALARKQPGRLNYASSGIGTIPHLATETIKRQAQIHMVHIPYRGAAQIANDVAGHQLDLAMLISASATAHVQAGTLKALAVTGDTRLPTLPNVPTVAETPGFKGFNVESWSGIYAPAKTPAAIVQQMNQELDAVLKMDAVRSKLADTGVVARGGSPATFAAYIERDRAQTRQMLRLTPLKE